MISLRLRLALLLAISMIVVVLVAVLVTVAVLDRPGGGDLERSFVLNAQATARLLAGSPEKARAAGLAVGPRPTSATLDADLTAELDEARRELGVADLALMAVKDENRRWIAMRIDADDWIRLSYPPRLPSPIKALLSYLALVLVGTAAVALVAAARIVGPLRMLEGALSAVRPDGTLAPVPEHGPAEVRATARALNALSLRLRAAIESRMRLVAAAGHDLRTPMTRMRLRAEFLPDGERERWLRDLEELDRIADSAIRLVREETDTTAFETCSLATIVRRAVADVAEAGLPAWFAQGPDPTVRAQPFALGRAVRNLVENAARHGNGAFVRVEATDGRAAVVVEDRGPGIPAELLDRVLEPFFRVDAGRRKTHAGAGLGLAIAREIVERQGGTLAIRNREGGGLQQDVGLPLTSDGSTPPADAGPAADPCRRS